MKVAFLQRSTFGVLSYRIFTAIKNTTTKALEADSEMSLKSKQNNCVIIGMTLSQLGNSLHRHHYRSRSQQASRIDGNFRAEELSHHTIVTAEMGPAKVSPLVLKTNSKLQRKFS